MSENDDDHAWRLDAPCEPLWSPRSALLDGRFGLTECLKARPTSETWRGTDTADGSPVVVKLVAARDVSSAVRLRLEHEARVLGQVNLPSRPVAVGMDGWLMYLVQSYVEGQTLQDRLADGPLSVGSTLRVGIEVLGALQTAHDLGVVHRDVKPANIVVSPDEPVQRVTLIDFGLARSTWLDPSVRDEPVGTARYMAPEATGLVEAEVDERADLYSAGAVLYECLTGRPPFGGDTVGEVLRAHASEAVPSVRSARRGVPGALDAVIGRLLAKNPTERYQSAQAVISDLEAIEDGIRQGLADPPVAIGLADRRRSLTEAGFIGRGAELAALEAVVSGHGRRSGVVLVEAESGGGKSRLLEEMCLRLPPTIRVLRGQGADRIARRPFQILDGVASSLAAACLEDPALGAAIAARLGSRIDAATAALPALATALGSKVSSEGPEAFGEARALAGLAALLDGLDATGVPFVVVLDDVQWADALTVKLLTEWPELRRSDTEAQVVVVAAFRSEEVDASHPLRKVPAVAHLALSPLGEADIESLCESMAGPLPPATTAAVIRLAEGNPFMAAAVLRGLVEAGVLRHDPDGWQVDEEGLQGAQTSRRAGMFLVRHLEVLSAEGLRLLSAGAVLGKEFDLDAALALANLVPDAAAAALEESRRRRVVWVDERTGRCAFAHDKLRETLLEALGPEAAGTLHRRAAEQLEKQEPPPVYELAYHFDAAGLPARAFAYAVEAARTARERHALDVAIAQYRIAERGASFQSREAMRGVYEGLGEVLSLAGDYPGAEAQLRRALEMTTLPAERAALEGKLGEVAFRRGDQAAARAYLEGALRQQGRWIPKTRPGFIFGLVWELIVQTGHTLFPRRLGRRSLDGADGEFLAARLYSRLAYIFWFNAGRVPCAWVHLREMNLVERFPPTPELAQAWSEHAPALTMIPWNQRGITYAKKSFEVRVALGDEWGQGQSLNFYAVALYTASRYQECIEAAERAVQLLSRTGDRWEENTAQWQIAICYYRLGEVERAVEIARRVHARASAIGDQTARGITLSIWSRASGGNVPADLVAAELAVGIDDAHTAVEVRVAEGVRLIGEGEWTRACDVLDQALRITRSSGLRQEFVAPAQVWAATAQRGRLTSMPAVAGRQRGEALREARRASRRALLLSRSYRNNLPHALREAGLVAAVRGRDRRAQRLLARSAAVATAQGAAQELALTRIALESLSAPTELDPPATRPERARPEAGPRRSPELAPVPSSSAEWSFSVADRFATLLEVGREISSAPSAASVYEAVRDGAVRLLRGDRCHIIEIPDDRDVAGVTTTESGHPVDKISHHLIQRVLQAGRPVIAGESLADDSSESLVLSNARSSICAPIFCDGQPVACLYVLNRHLAGLFGDEELQLASFVTTLAGAALEHVAGSEARFRSLVQNSSDVITIVDEYGLISYQSSSITKVFGFEPGAMIGRPLNEWLHPDDVELFLAALAARHDADAGPRVGCRMSDVRGTWHHVETAVTDLLGDPGVRGVVLNTRDISERVALETELRHRAGHDVVTGLANRALFAERVEHARASHAVKDACFALLFLDLDDFKSVNDTLGHATGDQILRVVAERLLRGVRPEDTVARFGGDEFAILIEDSDLDLAVQVGERILSSLTDTITVLGHDIEARASIGIVMSDAAEGAEGLMAAADTALYVAKARGKRRYEVFEPSMRSAAIAKAGLRTELDQALARSELTLHYQPIVTVTNGEIAGFEALLRWARPHGPTLTPDHFIALAEESGVIIPIGAWVLTEACRQARAWSDSLGRSFTMAVNVSTRQLQHPRLIDDIESAVAAAGVDPSVLVLEITESATFQDTDTVISRLHQLKDLGVGLAIDDFGTGYSALSYLRRLPVDILKIDRSFVSGLGRNPEDAAIVETVVALANAFGLQTVAEGVETLQQLELLAKLGCQQAQGFNWRPPGPPEEMTSWILDGTPRRQLRRSRVLVVDDSLGIRAALRVALETDGRFEVAGEAADGPAALREAQRLRPELILLDLVLPGSNGLDVLTALREASPATEIVILTAVEPSEVPADTILAARAVLDKTRDLSAVIEQLAEVTQASRRGHLGVRP